MIRTKEWGLRLLHELEYWNHRASFVTLTYSDECLPADGSVSVDEAQRWLKRLRAEVGRIRYFLAAEYGELRFRPHYHAIVFGVDPVEDREVIEASWRLGFVHVGTVTSKSIRYVCDYMGKSPEGPLAEVLYGSRAKPFRLQSKGLGRQWCDEHGEDLRAQVGTTVGGVQYGLPRYYCKRLGIEASDPVVVERRLESLRDETPVLMRRSLRNGTRFQEEREAVALQAERDLVARDSLRERRID